MNYLASKPLTSRPPQPMFYIDNIVDFLSICRRGNTELLELEETLEYYDQNAQRKIASFQGISVSRDLLSGSCEIMCNPKLHLHTRCDVADALTVMLPGHEVENDDEYDDYHESSAGAASSSVRTAAFKMFSKKDTILTKSREVLLRKTFFRFKRSTVMYVPGFRAL